MATYGERLESALIHQVKVELAERDWEQKDLAAALEMDPATLNRYIKGRRPIPMATFFRMAEVLGLTARELMSRAEARIQ